MNKLTLLLVGIVVFNCPVIAQDLTVTKTTSIELTKASREGRYGGTFIEGDKAKVIYVSSTKDEGAQIEQYDLDISAGSSSVADKFVSAEEANETMPWFMPRSQVEKKVDSKGKWLEASRAFGSGMKLNRGYVQKNYFLGVYIDMDFIKEESIKPKTGDIWRITPGGYKSLSDVDAMATSNGFYRDIEKFGNPLLMPADATLLASGVITEKVKLSTDQKYAANRVAVLTMNGMNFDDMKYDIYTLPYTAATVISGPGQDDNMCSLFAPLNGPTTLKSLKHLYWKDNKDYFTVMRFGDDRSLIDSVSFRSKILWGDYQFLNGNGSTYLMGKGNAGFEGWYRGLAYSKLNGFSVVKIKDGKLLYNKIFDEDEIKSKLVGAGGGKVKFKLYIPRNNFDEVVDLPNGDALVIGHTPLEWYALQLSSSGDLKAFYLVPLGKQDEIGIINYQSMMKGDDLILSINLQPVEFSTKAKITSTSTTIRGAYITSTITKTTVKKLNEVFMVSHLLRLNTATQKLSNKLSFEGKPFYPMGSFPAMFTKDAVFYTGREKGPKGKVIHVSRIDL